MVVLSVAGVKVVPNSVENIVLSWFMSTAI